MKRCEISEIAEELGCLPCALSPGREREQNDALSVKYLFPLDENAKDDGSAKPCAVAEILVVFDKITKEEVEEAVLELLKQNLKEEIELRVKALQRLIGLTPSPSEK